MTPNIRGNVRKCSGCPKRRRLALRLRNEAMLIALLAIGLPCFGEEPAFFRYNKVVESQPVFNSQSGTDYDDLVALPQNEVIAYSKVPGSQAVDIVRVSWLDDHSKGGLATNSSLWVSPAASALLMRDEQMTGIEGGNMGPQSANPTESLSVAPQITSFAHDGSRYSIGFLYGVRVLDSNEDHFGYIDGISPIILNMRMDKRIIGPQAGIVWSQNRGPLSFAVQGLALMGYNSSRLRYYGELGKDQLPGRYNHPLNLSRQEFAYARSYNDFAPSGELQAETNTASK